MDVVAPVFSPPDGLALWIPIPPEKHPLRLGCEHSVRYGLFALAVPEGFACDGASIPRPLRLLFPTRTLLLVDASGIYHDYCYRVQPCSRWQADSLFRSVMHAYRVPTWARFACWAAVRAFGWIVWRKYSRQIDAQRRELHFDSNSEGFQK